MPTIPQKELRNNIGEILRRAEAGEEFTITVSGRPVAELGPRKPRTWVSGEVVNEILKRPADPDYMLDIEEFGFELRNPWEL
jgi:prevent-host-death family protein